MQKLSILLIFILATSCFKREVKVAVKDRARQSPYKEVSSTDGIVLEEIAVSQYIKHFMHYAASKEGVAYCETENVSSDYVSALMLVVMSAQGKGFHDELTKAPKFFSTHLFKKNSGMSRYWKKPLEIQDRADAYELKSENSDKWPMDPDDLGYFEVYREHLSDNALINTQDFVNQLSNPLLAIFSIGEDSDEEPSNLHKEAAKKYCVGMLDYKMAIRFEAIINAYHSDVMEQLRSKNKPDDPSDTWKLLAKRCKSHLSALYGAFQNDLKSGLAYCSKVTKTSGNTLKKQACNFPQSLVCKEIKKENPL